MLKKFVRTMAYIGGIATGFYLFASAPGIHKKKKWQTSYRMGLCASRFI